MTESDASTPHDVRIESGSLERAAGGLATMALFFALAWVGVVTATGAWGGRAVERAIRLWTLAPFLVLLGLAGVRAYRGPATR